MSQVTITELALRDAHQCLLATRMRTEDMLPICDKMDDVGFWAIEMWGGATYDSCLRFLKEDPWERLTKLRKALPNTQLSMLLRGQNIVGYRHYADDVVEKFVELSAKNGIDVFRIFDALNDVRNLETSIRAVKKAGKHAQGAISYTISPVHNIPKFIEMAKAMEDLGCDTIAIKDMAGLLVPKVASELVRGLLDTLTVPLHLHTHATAGVAALSHMAAIEQGCVHIDTAISALSEGASHTCTESMVLALKDTEYDTMLDLNLLQDIGDHFRHVRKKYHQFESEATDVDPRVGLYQVPGGMISNLYNQLREQNAEDRMPEVHEEIPRVRKELGYPPLVTPTSQVVGTQAVMNVLTGVRYQTITKEVKLYCQGYYGKPPAEVDPKVRQQAIGQAEVFEGRPADLLSSEYENQKQEIGTLAKNPEDVISYILFPDIAKQFFEERESGTLSPEPLEAKLPTTNTLPTEFMITVHGEQYHVDLTGVGQASQTHRPYYLSVDGIPEEVLVNILNAEEAVSEKSAKANSSSSKRPKVTKPDDIHVLMPSSIIDVLVKVGDHVSEKQTLLIAEAMKMESEVVAPHAGVVEALYIEKGDSVEPDEVLMIIKQTK